MCPLAKWNCYTYLKYVTCFLFILSRWGFYSDSHDIKFGIISKNGTGSDEDVVPVHRVTCQEVEEIGVIPCPKPATCKYLMHRHFVATFKIWEEIIIAEDISWSMSRVLTTHTSLTPMPKGLGGCRSFLVYFSQAVNELDGFWSIPGLSSN